MEKKRNNRVYLIIAGLIAALVLGKFLLQTISLFPFFWQLIFNKTIELKHQNDKVNILILGIAGANHDGPQLTDTIIFSSLNIKENKITMVSIPRDLYAQDIKGKINRAYADGEAKKEGGGLILTKAIVEKILNQSVDYGIRIDFNGFIKAVDLMGGLDVVVDQVLNDYQYPIDGKETDPCGQKEEELEALATASSQLEAFPCRYEHIHFDKGLQHMDGAMALKFVRSRHAEGSEGSDFARSKRQEKIIKAFKDKAFSLQVLTNPGKIINLYSILKGSIDTDIKDTELDDFIRLFAKMKTAKIQTGVLDTGNNMKLEGGLLINPPTDEFDGQWVLIPRKGRNDFSEIQNYVGCLLKTGDCSVSKSL